MQVKKLIKYIRQINLNPYYKAFMLWRLKHLTEYQFVLILSLLVGLFSGLASVILKNTVHFTYEIISGFSWFSPDRGNILFLFFSSICIFLILLLVMYFLNYDLFHGVS